MTEKNGDKFINRTFHILSLSFQLAIILASMFVFFLKTEHRITVVETKLEYIGDTISKHIKIP